MTTEELIHEVMHLRRVLDDIEGYEIDWAVGTGENMARVQNMACAALNRPIPSETAPADPKEGTGERCGACGSSGGHGSGCPEEGESDATKQ